MPSARKTSSLSVVSPMPAKTTGAPVTSLMLSAAPPPGVAVELGEDHAAHLEAIVEGAHEVLHRVLADHGVDHEEDRLTRVRSGP